MSPTLTDPLAPLFPALERVREASRKIALAVAREAQRAGLAEQTSPAALQLQIDAKIWQPQYRKLRR